MTESVKTGLLCTSNYTHSMDHNSLCEYANNPNFASFTVLCVFALVSNLYTYRLLTEQVMCHNIGYADKTCFGRPVHIYVCRFCIV